MKSRSYEGHWHRWHDHYRRPRPWPPEGPPRSLPGQEYNVDLLPKVKLELVVPEARYEEVLKTLTAAARSGKIGDGKIFVFDVAEAIRIRNDDRGETAL